MKNLGVVILGLGLLGTLGGGRNPRGLVAAAVLIIATRVILHGRGQRRASV